eukprot:scaffold504_cov189-Ochromonas_danica.AAC.16
MTLGYILRTRSVLVDGNNVIIQTIVIKPHWDLVLEQDVLLDLAEHSLYNDYGGVLVRLVDNQQRQYFPPENVQAADGSGSGSSGTSDDRSNGNGNGEDRIGGIGSSKNRMDYDRKDEENKNGDSLTITLPWMKKYRYPLAVWFYSLRLLLKKPLLELWRGSVLLGDLWHVPSNPSLPSISNALQGCMQSSLTIFPGVGRNRGRRKYMEDIDTVFEHIKINEKFTYSVFGVFDGHGGEDCAHQAADDIPIKITANLRRGLQPVEALFKSFRDVDDDFLHSTAESSSGDTRAVLSRNRQAINLSYDRKANDPEEIARIAHAGGFVVNNRVSGFLAVSRAIGDSKLKLPQPGTVIVDPEISFFSPCLEDEFIIIATDGLWDVTSSQDAVDYIRHGLEKEGFSFNPPTSIEEISTKEPIKPKLIKVANDLVNYAISQGSADNITVMILFIAGSSVDASAINQYLEESKTQFSVDFVNYTSSSVRVERKGTPSPALSREGSGKFSPVDPAPSMSRLSSFRNEGIAFARSGRNLATSSNDASVSAAIVKKEPRPLEEDEEEDDDMMSFLKDDKNF